MEALAKLEEERGNPAYATAGSGRRKQKEQEIMSGNKTTGRVRDGAVMQSGGRTPEIGIKREKGDVKERVASNEMCTFLILNISSLQLIPVNMSACPACF